MKLPCSGCDLYWTPPNGVEDDEETLVLFEAYPCLAQATVRYMTCEGFTPRHLVLDLCGKKSPDPVLRST